MAKSIWAVDLGDWSLKVVRCQSPRRTGGITVDLFDEIVYGDLPCGFEAGPMERQREGLLAFRKKYTLASGDDFCIAVTGSEVFSRFINLPPVPESLRDIIHYEARQQIPFDIDAVVWDYQPVKEEYELGEEIEVGLFALKKDRIDELMDLLGPWHQNLRVIQDAPLAAFNFLEYEGLCEDPLVVLDIGAATSDLLVLNPPRFWLRTLLVAGDQLTRILMQKFNVGLAEAERIKRRAGRSEHRGRVLRLFNAPLEELSNEVQRSLGYYKGLARDVKFERILTIGGTLKLDGLSDMLGRRLQYEMTSLDGLNNISLAETVNRKAFNKALPSLCAALGLLVQGAHRGRMRVNLVPNSVLTANELNKKKPWALASALCLLVVIAVLIVTEVVLARTVDEAVREVRNVANVPPLGLDEGPIPTRDQITARIERSIVGEIAADKEAYEAKTKALGTVEDKLKKLTRAGVDARLYVHMLPVLAQALPEDIVHLRSLRFAWRESSWLESLESDVEGVGEDYPPSGEYGPPPEEDAAEAEFDERQPRRRRGMEMADTHENRFQMGAPPVYGEKSSLVMFFECESLNTDADFVDSQVFDALAQLAFAGRQQKMFTKVERVGRITADIKVIEEEKVELPIIIFRGYAVVDIRPMLSASAGDVGARGNRTR